jgi:hypothetical protein
VSETTTVSVVPPSAPALYWHCVLPAQEIGKVAPEPFGEIVQLSVPTPPAAVNVHVSPAATVVETGARVRAAFTVIIAVAVLFSMSFTVTTSV